MCVFIYVLKKKNLEVSASSASSPNSSHVVFTYAPALPEHVFFFFCLHACLSTFSSWKVFPHSNELIHRFSTRITTGILLLLVVCFVSFCFHTNVQAPSKGPTSSESPGHR